MPAARPTFLAFALLSAAGCVLGPFDLDEITSTGSRTFSGYSQTPSSTIRVRAFNQATQRWVTIATAQSSSSPDLPAGMWANNPNLYAWTVNASLSSCFLNPSCTPQLGTLGVSTVRMVFEEGSTNSPTRLIVFDESWSSCMSERTARGEEFTYAAYNCRAPSFPELRLRFVEEWSRLPTGGPVGPAIAVSPSASMQQVFVTSGSSIRESHASVPGPWSAWNTIPGGPATGFAPVAPAFVAGFPSSELFALGNDGVVYRSSYTPASNTFTPLAALAGITCLPTRLAASGVLNGDRTVVGCPVAGGNVQLSTYEHGAFVGGRTIPGTEVVLLRDGDTGDVEIHIAARDVTGISIWHLNAHSDQLTFRGSFDPGPIEDLSQMSGNDYDGFDLLVARPNLGFGEIVAFKLMFFPFRTTSQVVGTYALGGDPARLALQAGWAIWRDTGAGLRAARFSRTERALGQIASTTIGGTATLVGRPVFFSGMGPTALAFGTDGRARVINVDANAIRHEVERDFDVFATPLGSGCASDPNVTDPTWIQDLALNHEKFVSWIGGAARAVPPSIRSNFFREVAQHDCEQNASQPATWGRTCELAKSPIVMISQTPNSYSCPDGVYVSPSLQLAALEFGRVIARGFGVKNDRSPPAAWNADLTGVPLAELAAGAALFAEQLDDGCVIDCAGFAGWGAEERRGPEEAFSAALDRYVYDGNTLKERTYYQRMRSPCNDLLSRKYDWIRRNVFHGVEFDATWAPEIALCP